ncbi:hypothetical protein [Tepidimonas charontis]|uniref:Transmembrane protein n=1 Tax=Tepidimonas charontis TaxID=2267262 RepID=A0A554XJ95_9BURK|nr:hypothetical protein [Tepidimonas charontis]TSE35868.1 hypothetical protein Tchar_00448 [Tepidimonas charontis]
MYLVLIAWGYVVLMMAVAEAMSPAGSILGAIGTALAYGVLPMALVAYIAGSPLRRRARQRAERPMTAGAAASTPPDDGGHTPAAAEDDRVAPVREKP